MLKPGQIFLILLFNVFKANGYSAFSPNKVVNDTSHIYILNHSQLEEFYKYQYDTVKYLYISMNDQLKEKIKLGNLKYLKELIIHCDNFNELDPFSINILGSLEKFELYVRNLDTIPVWIENFVNLEKMSLTADSSLIEEVDLENFLRIKSLKDLNFLSKSFVKKVKIGGNNARHYNSIQIGAMDNNLNIGSISFDTTFFNNTIIDLLLLSAHTIDNFTGSSTFVVLNLTFNCRNTKYVIEAMNLNCLELIKKLQLERRTSIAIVDFSRFESIPRKLLQCNFYRIKLYEANNLKSISNLDYNTTWPLHIYIYNVRGTKKLFSEINQNKLLFIYIKTDKVKYRWIKHIRRLGDLELVAARKLSYRIIKKIAKVKKSR